MFDFSWALVIYNWRGAWEKEKANSVRNLGGGGGLLPCIVVSNGHKFWFHEIRHQVYYLAQMKNSRFDFIQIQDKLKEESDSLLEVT